MLLSKNIDLWCVCACKKCVLQGLFKTNSCLKHFTEKKTKTEDHIFKGPLY